MCMSAANCACLAHSHFSVQSFCSNSLYIIFCVSLVLYSLRIFNYSAFSLSAKYRALSLSHCTILRYKLIISIYRFTMFFSLQKSVYILCSMVGKNRRKQLQHSRCSKQLAMSTTWIFLKNISVSPAITPPCYFAQFRIQILCCAAWRALCLVCAAAFALNSLLSICNQNDFFNMPFFIHKNACCQALRYCIIFAYYFVPRAHAATNFSAANSNQYSSAFIKPKAVSYFYHHTTSRAPTLQKIFATTPSSGTPHTHVIAATAPYCHTHIMSTME